MFGETTFCTSFTDPSQVLWVENLFNRCKTSLPKFVPWLKSSRYSLFLTFKSPICCLLFHIRGWQCSRKKGLFRTWPAGGGRSRGKEGLKVVKTCCQFNLFQLPMFWQLTCKASYYEEIIGKSFSSLMVSWESSVQNIQTQCFETTPKHIT